MELFQLIGKIAIDSSGVDKSINSVESNVKSKIGTIVSTAGTKISTIGTKITKAVTLTGAAAVAAGTGIVKFAEKSASAADNVDKMSQKIGISREAYQELDFICSQSGTSVDTLQAGMKTLTNQMQSAQSGTKSAVEAFEKLGVSIYDSNGNLKDQETMMWEAMIALQNMSNQTEKAALANDLFGRSGSELMPLLNGAAGSIDNMRQKAHDLGLVMTDETVDSGVKLTDTIDQLKRSFTAIAVQLGSEFMPMIQQAAQYIIDNMPEIRAKISEVVEAFKNIISKVSEVIRWFKSLDESTQKNIIKFGLLLVAIGPILTVFGNVITVVGNVITVGSQLFTGIGSIISIGSKLLTGIGSITSFVVGKLIPAIMGINPVVLVIVAAIGAAIAIGVALYQNWDEISAFASKVWDKIAGYVGDAKDKIVGFFKGMMDWIGENWQGLVALIVNPFVGGFKLLYDNCESFRNFIDGFLGNIHEIFSGSVEKITGKAKELKENVVNAAHELKEKAAEAFDGLKERWQAGFSAAKERIVSLATELKDSAVSKIHELKESASSKIGEFADTAASKFAEVKEKGSAAIQNLRDAAMSKFSEMGESIGAKFSNVANTITGIFEKAKENVSKIADTVKGLFNFDWKLPDIKLPHFKLDWETSGTIAEAFQFLGMKGMPKVGIDWYSKAMNNPMIMDSPTVFGITSSGRFMGGGEAGSEVVSGTDTLMNMISAAVAANNQELIEVLYGILNAILNMDDGMSEKLKKALDGTSLNIQEREFARIVRKVVL